MRFISILWDNEDDSEGNVQHIARHGLTVTDVEGVLRDRESDLSFSKSTGRPVAFGFTPAGRYVMVAFELIDDLTVYPITAYEVKEPKR